MQNHFPLWKNLLVLLVFGIGIIYALPNLYGDDPSVQVSSTQAITLGQEQANRIESEIKKAGVAVRVFEFKDGQVLARFNNTSCARAIFASFPPQAFKQSSCNARP